MLKKISSMVVLLLFFLQQTLVAETINIFEFTESEIKDLISNSNYEKLKIEYWVKKMKSNKVNNSNSFSKKEKLLTTKFNIFKYKLNLYINSYLKKLNYFLLRIKKLFNVVTKNNRIT